MEVAAHSLSSTYLSSGKDLTVSGQDLGCSPSVPFLVSGNGEKIPEGPVLP